jgi:hypothetical protein
MKKTLLLAIAILLVVCPGFAQIRNHWSPASTLSSSQTIKNGKTAPSSFKVYELDVAGIKKVLQAAPDRASRVRSEVIVTFPAPDGSFQNYKIVEASVFHPELAAKYPGIKSYAGQGIDDPTATIRFSICDQFGFHGMVLSGKHHTYYIDPYSTDRKHYSVYARESLSVPDRSFTCLTNEGEVKHASGDDHINARTNDKKLRKYRLALSCNAEYGNIFAGSGTDAQKKANILAQMNITMTRVNGVYEKDLAVTMEIVPNNDLIIYFGSTTTDPWSGEFNNKTQQVIDAAIGNANYDIGHNFNTSGGGNAGCIGCVCTTGSKGSGYTGSSNPTGDPFDIDYVAHEMGHQFGGYHTQSNASCISGSGLTEVEPGSGSTIMSYAGICSANVQSNSDAYFHYVNIRDISANIQTGTSSSCAQVINLANNAPTANAGPDYTIPKSTAFVLRGSGSDPDGDALIYTWEQNDPQPSGSANNSAPSPTKTTGPMFRSRFGTASPDRYMPQISDVVNNNITPTWEVVPSVARTLNFALTVRDNKAGGGQNSDDLMRVTVNGTAGPFVVTAPNTAISWTVGSTQNVTWNVAGTNAAPISTANVNILLSTDGGFTYPITLLASTPNDGTQAITVPNNLTTTARVKVEAVGNIYYDISNANFTITNTATCTATVPTGLAASGITTTGATLSWNPVSNATYDLQYRTGTGAWTTVAVATTSTTLSGLTPNTTYQAQVRSKCTSTTSAWSALVNFTTLNTGITYCASKGNSVSDEYINRVQLGTINNTSGPNAGYGNFTSLSTDLARSSANTITITPTWTGTVYNEGYAVWIDYNKDGDFADAGELVFSKAASKTTPATGSFTVPSTATLGSTRMRVSMKYNGIPTSCETFSYGEVEDYSVNITAGGATCANVTVTIVLDNYPEETSWNIKNSGGTTVASGGPYGSSPDGSTITSTVCLPVGCSYTFTINDSYGDGICCSFGNGSYNVKNAAGVTLFSGASFTSSAAHTFCVTSAARGEQEELVSSESFKSLLYPNPVQNTLYVTVPEGVEVKGMRITTMTGSVQYQTRRYEKEVNVSGMSPGFYLLQVDTNKGLMWSKFSKE